MYQVVFYRDQQGKSEIVDMLDDLARKAEKSKSDRINREKILVYIGALEQYGTRVGQPIVKRLQGDLWELRPLKNRILFCYWKDDTFILLSHFVKKTQKTPKKEIDKAISRLNDYLSRNEKIRSDKKKCT